MTLSEFQRIRSILKANFKNFLNDANEIEVWYNSLKSYDAKVIEDAAWKYNKTEKFEPRIASLLEMIPKADNGRKFTPMFEEIEGRTVPVISCQRCRDTGLITYEDDDGRTVGRPCDCPAGHAKYSWGWLTQEEQQQFVATNGSHGEVVGERWYR